MSMAILTRSYSELEQLTTFDARFEYLCLGGELGRETFGFDRWINQQFYQSVQWKNVRRHVILRDNACDLGIFGYEIGREPLVHHMNPVTHDAIVHGEEWILDPEFLITTTKQTHNAIHYMSEGVPMPKIVAERQPNDTKLW